jgi:hypothetical protein
MSTIPAVIAALKTLAEATLTSPPPNDWQVIDGPATTETVWKQRMLVIADEEILSPTDFDSLGAFGMEERYTVPLLLSVSLPGPDSLPTCRTEAFAAHELIRDALLGAAADRRLGLTAQGVLNVVPTGERRIQQFATETGRSVAIRFGVDVYAQLI